VVLAPLAAAAHDSGGHGQGKVIEVATAPNAASEALDIGGPFSLIDHEGRARRDADYRGDYLLVYFGYTACPYTCSTALVNLAGALDELGAEGAGLTPLFISVDPEYDTPERLAPFVAAIHPRLVGLTGTPAQVRAALAAYRVEARPVEDKGAYARLIDHGPFAYLMGPDGQFLTLFPPIVPPQRMAAIIRGYLH
jgi:protein SCO1/2